MPTLTFDDPVPFVNRGIKEGNKYREIKPDKGGGTFYFLSEEHGQVTLVILNPSPLQFQKEVLVSVEDFDTFYEPLIPEHQPQDE
jgi:hypothetical protein